MTKRVMRVLTQSPLFNAWSIALSDSETAEALAESLEAQFQPITVYSVLTVTDVVNVGLMSFVLTPASDPKLTNPDEVHKAFMGLKFTRPSGLKGILNRA